MSTTTLRLDALLKRRFASLAQSAGRTPHSLMVEALEQKAGEMEAARVAAKRDQAMLAGQQGIDWHDMKTWLRGTAKAGATTMKSATKNTPKSITKTVKTKARA